MFLSYLHTPVSRLLHGGSKVPRREEEKSVKTSPQRRRARGCGPDQRLAQPSWTKWA